MSSPSLLGGGIAWQGLGNACPSALEAKGLRQGEDAAGKMQLGSLLPCPEDAPWMLELLLATSRDCTSMSKPARILLPYIRVVGDFPTHGSYFQGAKS